MGLGLGTPKNVWRFLGNPLAATPSFQTSMEVFTSWTSYLADVARDGSGGEQPLEYGQVAALSDWPLNCCVSLGVLIMLPTAAPGERAVLAALGG